MLITIICIYSALIIPLFFKICVYYNKEHKKLFFQINAFGFIKIISGYATILQDGIAVHLTKNKAIFVPYKNMLSIGEKVKPLQDYHFIRISVGAEVGYKRYPFGAVVTASLSSAAVNVIGNVFSQIKPYLKINYDICLYKDERFIAYGQLMLALNLLMVVISIIKMLIGNLIKWKKKTK